MQPFNFHQPTSIADAVAAIKGANEGKFLAGGQSLIPVLKLDLADPSDIISLNGISELTEIKKDGNTVIVGALATHAQVHESPIVKEAIPGLAALAGGIGDPQVRHRGTIGGSVAHADPRADYPAALVALGATIKTDSREISAEAFFKGLFETDLNENEVITAVHFQVPEKSAYAKFASPASKYAVVGVMVAKHADGVRVAVTGASSQVFRVDAMETALNGNFSVDALKNIPISADGLNEDLDGPPEYRAHLVGVMARRAVAAAG